MISAWSQGFACRALRQTVNMARVLSLQPTHSLHGVRPANSAAIRLKPVHVFVRRNALHVGRLCQRRPETDLYTTAPGGGGVGGGGVGVGGGGVGGLGVGGGARRCLGRDSKGGSESLSLITCHLGHVDCSDSADSCGLQLWQCITNTTASRRRRQHCHCAIDPADQKASLITDYCCASRCLGFSNC